MEGGQVKLFDGTENYGNVKPEVHTPFTLIVVYLFLSLLSAAINLAVYAYYGNNGFYTPTQAVVTFYLYVFGFIPYIFIFIAGILITARDTYKYPKHSSLVLYGITIVLGPLVYLMFSSLSPTAFLIAALLAKTGLGTSFQVNIFYFGGILVQLLLIYLPLTALGMLFFEEKNDRRLLLSSFILFSSIFVLNLVIRVIIPPFPTSIRPVNGFSVYYFLQVYVQDMIQITAFLLMTFVFFRGRLKLKYGKGT